LTDSAKLANSVAAFYELSPFLSARTFQSKIGGDNMPTLLLIIVYLWLISLPVVADAQTRQAALAAVMKLPPAERQARLVEGSKKESGLVWYSSTTAEDALALIKRFNEQHPSIQIQHLRSSSEKLLERILAEARANAFKADIVALPELELSIMIKRKLLARYEGLENSIYPEEAKDPGGYWTGLYTSAWVAAYNTKMVNKDGAPKTYKDLLNAKWKGSIAMDTEPYNCSSFRCAFWNGETAGRRHWIT